MTQATKPANSVVVATQQVLDLIARENKTLNAFIATMPRTALAEAALADAKSVAGAASGALHGMPIAVKDIIDVAGIVTGCGSLTQAQSPPANGDAPVVSRLREAGAVVVGKTHTVEFAFGGYGTNLTVGTPWNPWDRTVHRTPGGSSSGSGAAVGGGLVPAALGTDTGGSVRIPAALCGCVGLKTSLGRVGRSRIAPLSKTLDSVGPIARDVATAARLFAVMQGNDPDDASTDGVRPSDPILDLEKGVRGMRFGRIADGDLPGASPEVLADFNAAVGRLTDLGARVETLQLPTSLDELGNRCGQIMAAEAYAYWGHYADDPKSGLAEPIRKRMLSGKTIIAANYIANLDGQRVAIRDFQQTFDRYDAIILPTLPVPAIVVADVDERVALMASYTRWVNYLNLCAIAVPTALSKGGLPLSLQIVVRHQDDALALRIGRAFEVHRGAFPRPRS